MQGPQQNINLANSQSGNLDSSRNQQELQLQSLNRYANRGPGPSAAQALLGNQTAAAQRGNLALARSGRGTGSAANMRAALGQNANMQGAANNQAAALSAQEEQAWRQQQLGALTAAQQGAAGIRAGDAGLRGQDIGLTGQQLQADLTSRGQNFGLANNQLQADLGSRGQNMNYAGTLGQQALGWQEAGQGWAGLGNQQDQLALGYGNLGNQYNQTAQGADQLALGNENLAREWAAQGQQGGMGYEQLRGESYTDAQIANMQGEQQRDAALVGGLGGLAQGAMAMSDENSKKEIERLESMNRALTSSLQGRESYPTPRQPDTAALDAVRKTPAYSYRYKDPSAPGAAPGPQAGVMAQDLEKTPRGADTVMDTPQGKMVDTGRLELMNTGALQAQQEELDQLRAQVAALSQDPQSTANWEDFYGR
jgi:hypothetical protein